MKTAYAQATYSDCNRAELERRIVEQVGEQEPVTVEYARSSGRWPGSCSIVRPSASGFPQEHSITWCHEPAHAQPQSVCLGD